MRARCVFALLIALTVTVSAWAEERVIVCYNYSCLSQAPVIYRDEQLLRLQRMFARVGNAEQERETIANAIGRLLAWAGEQTPIAADRGGNVADAGVNGRMDCIDHSRTTTRLLQLLEAKGWLRYHRTLDVVNRKRFFLFDHFSAQIGELTTDTSDSSLMTGGDTEALKFKAHYAVDSWFFDNGHPATVMPLERWLAGESPDVSDK